MRTGFALLGALIILVLAPMEARTNSSGAPPGRAGSPAEGGATCNASGCHLGSATNSGPGSITVSGPMSYGAGQAVRLEITVEEEGAQRIGFQVTAVEAASGTHAGSWNIVDSATKFAGGNSNYVTHSAAPFGSSSRTFSVEWTAPQTAVGTVMIYVAGNAANGNSTSTGDQIYTTQHPLAESGTAAESDLLPSHFTVDGVFPNPAPGQARLAMHLPASAQVQVTIADLLGRQVFGADFTLPAGRQEVALPVSGLLPGTYLVTALSGTGPRLAVPLVISR